MVRMKKNTVITIVIAALLCLVLLGAANAPRRIVSPVASKYMNDPQSVTFIDENSKTTVFIEKGGKFISTKTDGHGIGLESVRAIVRKNKGYCNFRFDDTCFYSEIMLRQV